jgi:hypothetical protein
LAETFITSAKTNSFIDGKTMRYILSIILSLLSFLSLKGQSTIIAGKVTNANGIGIPGCSIHFARTSSGSVTDENGIFRININTDSFSTFLVSAIGYQTKEVDVKNALTSLQNGLLHITLNAVNISLKDATIAAKRGSKKQGILGKKGLRHAGGCYMQYGEEVAIFLQAEPDTHHGFLKSIHFYITDEGAPLSRFKVNVYKNFDDTALEIMPGDKLMEAIYTSGTKGNSWVSVNLSDRKIDIKGGVFISMEWVRDSNSTERFPFQDPLAWHFCGSTNHSDRFHNGQVLGTTWGYGVLSKTFIRDHSNSFEWRYSKSPFSNDRHTILDKLYNRIHPGYYPNAEHHWYNPMIYATYTY